MNGFAQTKRQAFNSQENIDNFSFDKSLGSNEEVEMTKTMI